MELRTLITFQKIAQYGSFSTAARELGYAQSTVTTQIKQLESELGTSLFDRIGNRNELTQTGQDFLSYADELIFLSRKAKESISNTSTPSGTLTIAAIGSLCACLLPKLLMQYSTHIPEVHLKIKTASTNEILSMVQTGQADLGLYLTQDVTQEFQSLYQTRMPLCFLAAPSHNLASKHDLHYEDLLHEKFILTENSCEYRQEFNALFAGLKEKPVIGFETENTEIIKRFVEAGLGITMLPKIAAASELSKKSLVCLDLPGLSLPSFQLNTICHKKKWITPAMKEFIHLLREDISLRLD